jgi:hypothetical protein
VGDDVSAAPPAAPRESGWRSPFVVFGVVAIVAAAGAIAEAMYYAASPALSAGSLGTTLGILVAVAAFVVIGIFVAPPND